MNNQAMPAEKALEKLKEGNKTYLNSAANPGDVSVQIRKLFPKAFFLRE